MDETTLRRKRLLGADSRPTEEEINRLEELGIPKESATPAVALAVTALMEKLGDVTRELETARRNLAEVTQLVDADCLAAIPNRRAFMRRLAWAISMNERYHHPSTILYLDLNGFKRINDTYGHAAGDQAIQHVSKLLSSLMRESDFIARIGGDEFGVIMYYADETAARRRSAKIADQIQRSPFVFEGVQLSLTAALGSYSIQPGDTAELALSQADKAMFANKRKDRETAA